MRLFEIADEIEKILAERVDRETGEIGDEALAALEALEMERDQKALAIGCYLKGERAEGDAIAAEADRLEQRARIHHNRAKRLEEYIASHIAPGQKLSDARVAISWRRSTRVEIDAGKEESLPVEYLRIKTEPDRVAIKDALANGKEVPHAKLVERMNMVVK